MYNCDCSSTVEAGVNTDVFVLSLGIDSRDRHTQNFTFMCNAREVVAEESNIAAEPIGRGTASGTCSF